MKFGCRRVLSLATFGVLRLNRALKKSIFNVQPPKGHRLLTKSMLHLVLGGAALQRCDKPFILRPGFSHWGPKSASIRLFQQPQPPKGHLISRELRHRSSDALIRNLSSSSACKSRDSKQAGYRISEAPRHATQNQVRHRSFSATERVFRIAPLPVVTRCRIRHPQAPKAELSSRISVHYSSRTAVATSLT